jgi:hypothetical protein
MSLFRAFVKGFFELFYPFAGHIGRNLKPLKCNILQIARFPESGHSSKKGTLDRDFFEDFRELFSPPTLKPRRDKSRAGRDIRGDVSGQEINEFAVGGRGFRRR